MTTNQKIIKNKLGLLKLAETLGSVSKACKVMGFSQGPFPGRGRFSAETCAAGRAVPPGCGRMQGAQA